MKRLLITIIGLSILIFGCGKESEISVVDDKGSLKPVNLQIEYKPLKWFNGHAAAVSLTYDGGLNQWSSFAVSDGLVNDVIARGLIMDFEMVTATYEPKPWTAGEIKTMYLSRGIHVFGHGHTHINHDELSFQEAYKSFAKCFTLMTEWGLSPKAYAYPSGKGLNETTQLACKEAGFICARGFSTTEHYSCADDAKEPDNWYYLLTVSMFGGRNDDISTGDHNSLVNILEDALHHNAWTIITYHSIGMPESWGYYPHDEFIKDLEYISENDFWCSNMDNIACYIKERNKFNFRILRAVQTDSYIKCLALIADNLDNSVYNQPISFDLTIKSDLAINKIKISGMGIFEVLENKTRINAIPDDRLHEMTLYY